MSIETWLNLAMSVVMVGTMIFHEKVYRMGKRAAERDSWHKGWSNGMETAEGILRNEIAARGKRRAHDVALRMLAEAMAKGPVAKA